MGRPRELYIPLGAVGRLRHGLGDSVLIGDPVQGRGKLWELLRRGLPQPHAVTQEGPRASADRVPASALPSTEESSEEENERSEHKPGEQSKVTPVHSRQRKVDFGWRSSFDVQSHVPRHEDNEGQTRQAEPDYEQEQEQKRLKH